MDWLIIGTLIGSLLLLPTAYAGAIGAPWAPTKIASVKKAFDELKIDAYDVVVDLGCGDGKILREATTRGARAVGYELSPIMWVVAWLRVIGRNARIQYGNFFSSSLSPETTVIFMFLMPKHMEKVRKYLARQKLKDSTIVLSYAFPMQEVPSRAVFHEDGCAPLYMYIAEDIR